MQTNNDRMGGTPPAMESSAEEGGIARLSGAPTSESERFLADLKSFVGDAEVLLGQARTLSGEGALAAREEFERRLHQARRGYEAARGLAVDHAHDYVRRAESYAREEPWRAIGYAALAGAVIGVLLTRR